MKPKPDLLSQLAAKANSLYAVMADNFKIIAYKLGLVLIDARKQLGDEKKQPFKDWVAKHCTFKLRSAYEYLWIAENWDDLEGIESISACISLRKTKNHADVEASFPELAEEEQAEYREVVAHDERRTAQEREVRVREKQMIKCPNCGHKWKK